MNRSKPLAAQFHASEILFGEYVHRRGLARVLGLCELTLWRMSKDRTGPPITRIRRLVLYKISSVEAWLAKLEKKPSPPMKSARSAAHA